MPRRPTGMPPRQTDETLCIWGTRVEGQCPNKALTIDDYRACFEHHPNARVSCDICGDWGLPGTKRCNGCWEMESGFKLIRNHYARVRWLLAMLEEAGCGQLTDAERKEYASWQPPQPQRKGIYVQSQGGVIDLESQRVS